MNDKPIMIRDARPEEQDAVSVLLKEAYLQYQKTLPAEAWNNYLEDIMNVRSRIDVSQLIVAEVDKTLAGAVTLYLNPKVEQGWPEGWAGIRLLAVHPAFRGRGIGRALMNECIRRCENSGIRSIGLHTNKMMDVGLRMYEKMGFVRAPEFDFYPRPDVVVMAYRLDLK